MTEDRDSSKLLAAKAAKERAREYRKASYQKAKAIAKERRAALAASPEAAERKAAAKAKRRAAYKKSKEQTKAVKRKDQANAEKAQREAEAETAVLRQQELLRLITTADKISPAADARAKPKLMLVKTASEALPPR